MEFHLANCHLEVRSARKSTLIKLSRFEIPTAGLIERSQKLHVPLSQVKTLTPEFHLTINAAEGFFQLGMWEDAWAELEELKPEFRHLARVIILRILILNNLGKWEDAAAIGRGALRHLPNFGALYLATAQALRNCEGPAAAKSVVAAGESYLENEAAFHYMLACYDSALGNLDDAKDGLARAFELDKDIRAKALDEPDLAPLWESL